MADLSDFRKQLKTLAPSYSSPTDNTLSEFKNRVYAGIESRKKRKEEKEEEDRLLKYAKGVSQLPDDIQRRIKQSFIKRSKDPEAQKKLRAVLGYDVAATAEASKQATEERKRLSGTRGVGTAALEIGKGFATEAGRTGRAFSEQLVAALPGKLSDIEKLDEMHRRGELSDSAYLAIAKKEFQDAGLSINDSAARTFIKSALTIGEVLATAASLGTARAATAGKAATQAGRTLRKGPSLTKAIEGSLSRRGAAEGAVAAGANVGRQDNINPLEAAVTVAAGGLLGGGFGRFGELRKSRFADKKLVSTIDNYDRQITNLGKQGKLDTPQASKIMLERANAAQELEISIPRNQGRDFLEAQVPKEAGKLKRAFLSTSGQLSRLGEAGADLADRLSKARDTAEISVGHWSEQIPTVIKLGKRDFVKFVDALEARSRGEDITLPQNILRAVEEWNQLAPQIRQAALGVGLDVGNLGPNYFPKNYSQFLKKRGGLQGAANHMVNTGQASSVSEALQTLRFAQKEARAKPYGHLEYERVLDLPEFDKTGKALVEYLHFTGKRIGEAEQLGAKNEIANQLLDDIAAAGYDVGRADRNLRIALGQLEQQPTREAVSRNIRKFNALRSLRTAAIANLGQSTNTATVSGYTNLVKGIAKFTTKSGRKFVRESGTVSDAILRDISEQYGFDRGLISKIAAPIFGKVESMNRYIASLAGASWADSLAKKATSGSRAAVKQLRKLGVEGDIGAELTPLQRIQAARRLVERTQFKINPQDLPAWAASPEGKLVAQFRTFSYKQSKFMLDEVLRPASEGNLAPLTRFMAALPLGYAIYKGRNLVRGPVEGGKDFTKDDGWIETVKESYQALGAGGLAGDVGYTVGQYGKPRFGPAVASTLGGPTAGFVAEGVGSITEASRGNTVPLSRQATKSIPLVGTAISNRLFPYGGKVAADLLPDKKIGKQLANISEELDYRPSQPGKEQRGRKLSDKEYEEYSSTYFEIFQRNLSKVLNDSEFKEADAQTRKDTIQDVVRISGDEARDKMFGKEKRTTKKSKSASILQKVGL